MSAATSSSSSSFSSSSSTLVSTPTRPVVYLDIDIDGHAAAYQRGVDFVMSTNQRYGWSSKFLKDLGGSERARIQEAYENDYDWHGKGRIELDPFPHTRIIFQLFADAAPNCVINFMALCTGEKGKAKGSGVPMHYVGSKFHRLVKGTNGILQGGDYVHSTGTGGESIWGSRFKDDKPALKLKHNKRGILSMCNTGVNANGAQFFITLGPTPKCDGKHCVFGEIVSGIEVLDAVEKVDVDSSGVPQKPIMIVGAGKL